jgi:aryl-alcohol dehydrogenase
VVLSYRSCRECGPCRDGAPAYCDQHILLNYMGFRMDGSTVLTSTGHTRGGEPVQGSFFGQSSLASHAIAYADNCVVVDPGLDLSRLAPFGCGFQTGAGSVFNVLRPSPGEAVAVFGTGAVGLAAVAAARSLGVTTVAVDLEPGRLAIAERLGALTVNPAEIAPGTSLVQRVKELTGGGPAGAIDTTAVPAVAKQAQQALANRGTLLLLGLGPEEWALDAADLLASGKVVRSSVEGDADPHTFIPELLALRGQGRFPLDEIVTTYPASDIAQAVADVEAGKVIKPVLVW